MALFTLSDSQKAVVEEKPPEETIVYDQSTVTQYQNPEDSVQVSVTLDGSPWVTEAYYNQLLKEDDTPRQLDLGIDPSLQQYLKINNFVINATDALSVSTEKTSGISTVSGAGQMYATIVPQLGDMFVARMKDGKLGLFVIANIQRMQYLKNSGFEVEYRLFDYHNANFQADLTRKTVEVFNFNEDGVACGNGLVKTNGLTDPGNTLVKLVNWYYDLFYSRITETTLFPASNRVYDPFVVPFFNAIVDFDLRGTNPQPKQYTCQTDTFRDNMTSIWDVMIKSNEFGMGRIRKNQYLESPSRFSSDRIYGDISTSQVSQVIWLKDLPTLNSDGEETEDFYVFSKAFYDRDKLKMSILERAVLDGICGIKPSTEFLDEFVNGLSLVPPEKLFYHIPIAIYLIKIFMA